MNRWILPITGFTESDAQPTGIEKVWRQLRELKAADVCILTPQVWSADMKALAGFIVRNSESRPHVMVIAYSWGAGRAFVAFAREAATLGIDIDIAVLADPVFRSTLLPTWLPLNLRSILPFWRPKITVPESVNRVRWVRQILDPLVRGHDLVADDPEATIVEPAVVIAALHGRIDDSETFRAMALQAARDFTTPVKTL